MTDYSDREKKALRNFVTDTEADIYAVKNVRPEIFGAFGSFFSRSPKDVRDHILDAVKGDIKGHQISGGEERLEKLSVTRDYLEAQKKLKEIQRMDTGENSELEPPVYEPAQAALESGLEKAQSFFEKYYGTYGHKSIANTVWIPFVANNKSQLFARKLADDQLAFFIEQSTRYVEFDENYYLDPEVMDSEHSDTYEDTIKQMIDNYYEFADLARDFYSDRIPFDDWIDRQPEKIQEKSEDFLERKYEREINGKALDIARFLLPQAIETNIAWILDARSTEFDIATWKGHPLTEIQESAEMIEEAGGDIAPSLLKYTEESEYYRDKLHEYGGDLETDTEPEELEKGVNIVSMPDNLLDRVTAHILKENNPGKFQRFLEEAGDMSFEEKKELLERISGERGQYDEWIGANEELDLEKIVVEIKTDVGALRDIRRHQKNDRGEHRYTLDMGYYRPDVVEEMPEDMQELFDQTMEIAHEAEKQIRQDFPFAAQYVIPMAAMTTITMSLGLDQLQYLLYTRTTPEGNFSYREDMFNLAEEVLKEQPWLLGLREYPEGKDVRQVYKESDWNGKILDISTGETGLHT